MQSNAHFCAQQDATEDEGMQPKKFEYVLRLRK